MLDREDLQAIAQLISESENRMKTHIEEQLRPIRRDITELRESIQEVRDSTNYIADWVENLENAFNKHKKEIH